MSFAADVSKWCKHTAPQWVEGVTLKIIFELADRAVMRSPVGDADYWQSPPPPGYAGGAFRRNWRYGFGRASTDVLPGVSNAAIGEIQGAASGKTGVHYISNPMPYAERIETGWSSQAPQGIIGLIELEFPDIVRIAQA